jgi:hypothetical protein
MLQREKNRGREGEKQDILDIHDIGGHKVEAGLSWAGNITIWPETP